MTVQIAVRHALKFRMPRAAVTTLAAGASWLAAAAPAAASPEIRTSAANRVPACATPARLMAFLKSRNPQVDPRFKSIAEIYRQHGEAWRVRWDYAFFQMAIETNFLSYRRPDGRMGDVDPKQNNFAGIGTTGGGVPGDSYPDVKTGVLAQIQHLVVYSGEQIAEPVAPRTRLKQDHILAKSRELNRPVKFGDLARRWAVDPKYGNSIDWVAGQFRDQQCAKHTAAAQGEALPWAADAAGAASVKAKPAAKAAATKATPAAKAVAAKSGAATKAASPAAAAPAAKSAQPATARTVWARADAGAPAAPAAKASPNGTSQASPAGTSQASPAARAPIRDAAAETAKSGAPQSPAVPTPIMPTPINAEPAPAAAPGFVFLSPPTHWATAPVAAGVAAAPAKAPAPAVTAPTAAKAGGAIETRSVHSAPAAKPKASGGATASASRDAGARASDAFQPPAPGAAAPAEASATPVSPPPATATTTKAAARTEVAALPPSKLGAAPQPCAFNAARYGDGKTLLIRTGPDKSTYTALSVLPGFESSMAATFIRTQAGGGETIGEFASKDAALDRAREMCGSAS